MVSMTTFERTNYGDEFIDNFACKLGAENSSGITEINCLRSTVMDPWLCKDSTLDESYINTIIIPALRKAVLESLKEIL